MLGTAPYHHGHEGPQRDVYALALTLAELLTGEPPDPDVALASKRVPPALARVLESALRTRSPRWTALGHGGMGLVRLAFDTEARRQVALKTIVDGITLATTLTHRKIEPRRALTLAIDLCAILKAAQIDPRHAGMQHRRRRPP